MGRNRILVLVSSLLLLLAGCVKDNSIKTDFTASAEQISKENTDRITYINERISLSESGSLKSAESPENYSYTSAVDIYNTVFDKIIIQASNAAYTVYSGQTVLLPKGLTYSGNITVNDGGRLVVAGNLAGTAVSGAGTIVINPTGVFTGKYVNINPGLKLVNYGEWNVDRNINLDGILENHGIISFDTMNNNSSAHVVNTGKISLSGDLNNNGLIDNMGTFITAGTFNLNSGANLNNACHFEAARMQSNGLTYSTGFLKIDDQLTVNGGSILMLGSHSVTDAGTISLNGKIDGTSGNYAGIVIRNSFQSNRGARITGKIDIRYDTDITRSDPDLLGSRVTFKSVYFPATGCVPQYGTNPANSFTLVANVKAPIDSRGNTLSATSVDIQGDFAYVSYHLHGAEFGGLIEVYDITDPSAPTIVSQYWTENVDFNHLEVDGNKLYATGGQDPDKAHVATAATFTIIDLKNGELPNSLPTFYTLPSYSGDCVHLAGNGNLYLATGNTGGQFITANADNGSIINTRDALTAKYFDSDGNTIVGLQGGSVGLLSVFNENDGLNPVRTIPVGEIKPENGKSVVRLKDGFAYVCEGSSGLMVYDVSDGSGTAIKSFNPQDGDTNGVDVDHGLIYVANGAGGVYVLDKNTFKVYGNYNYDGSANFVRAVDDYIFVANGAGGLKILTRDNP
jgi:hypothetical protein